MLAAAEASASTRAPAAAPCPTSPPVTPATAAPATAPRARDPLPVTGAAWAGIDFASPRQLYYLVAAYALASTLALHALTTTPLGRMLNAVRDNPQRVAYIGYDPQRVRHIAFVISGFFAGVAGGLAALSFEFVGPEALGAPRSGAYLVFTVLGGTGFFFGPVVGAALMVLAQSLFSTWSRAWLLYLGLISLVGTPIPANQELSSAERQRRLASYYQPYHRRVDRHLKQLESMSLVPTLVSIHSFTPCLGSVAQSRPWPIGVLWDKDRLFAQHLIRELGREGGLVGDNQPYDGRAIPVDTVDRHAASRHLRHTTIELRQDQLVTPAMRARWAGRLYRALMATTAQLRAQHASS